jgi:tRNA(fMet)-specific endonuclease VapC
METCYLEDTTPDIARRPIEAAKLRQDLESSGTRIGTYDLLIAAQAISSNYTLVTANVCEFGRIKSLKLENWRAL